MLRVTWTTPELAAPLEVAADAAPVAAPVRLAVPVADAVETGAVPEGVNTPPAGSWARHWLAASDASCAVFGATTVR